MELLEEQKAELDSLRAKGVELEQATSQSAAAAAATANGAAVHAPGLSRPPGLTLPPLPPRPSRQGA